jgi:hypothetical protein
MKTPPLPAAGCAEIGDWIHKLDGCRHGIYGIYMHIMCYGTAFTSYILGLGLDAGGAPPVRLL